MAGPSTVPPGSDRPIGEILGDLVEDGKAYARAELDVVKAIASDKASGFKVPFILFGAALLLAMAALNAFAVAVFVMLALLMKPLLAALAAFLLIGGTAALLAWLGAKKLGNVR